ncbi:hypothetical protein, partial [Escherichia coli]|uniref:hypothetical protein n=1 Tax=Escherichia coli TaxID=562 RepID=UPI001299EA74
MPKAATLGAASLGHAATFGNLASIPAAEPAAATRPSTLPAYVIEELKREAGSLRDTLALLATDADIEDLDKAL